MGKGRFPVVEGRWYAVGGRWYVVGGRWGRRTRSGFRVSGDRCQVTGAGAGARLNSEFMDCELPSYFSLPLSAFCL